MPAYASRSAARRARGSRLAPVPSALQGEVEQAGQACGGGYGVAVVHAGHAQGGRGVDVRLDVVDEDALPGGEAELGGGVPEDLLLGFAHADFGRDYPGVEQLGE